MSSSPPTDSPGTPNPVDPPASPADVVAAPRRGRRPRKLRSTLVISVLLMITGVCGVVALVTEIALSNYLVGQLDSQLMSAKNQVIRFSNNGQNNPGHGNGSSGPTDPAGSGATTTTTTGSTDSAGTAADPTGTVGAVPTGSVTAGTTTGTTRFRFGDLPESCTPGAGAGQGGGKDPGQGAGPPPGLFQPGVALGTLSALINNGVIERAGILTGPELCQEPSAATLTALLSLAPADNPVNLSVDGYGDYRVLATELPNGDIAVTGLPLSPVRDTQLRLGVIMLIVTIAALLLAAAIVYFIVRRNLRPLDRVAATARQVVTVPLHEGEVDLSVRVPARDTDPRTEVGQVGSALNQLLGHVSDALTARQESEMQVRQFVADASHELRTPLASIRGYAELAQRDQVDAATVTHALRRVESESQRMTSLVDDLLLLARLDAGRPLSEDPVDLTMLMIDVVSDAQVAGPDHHWQLELPEEPIEVRGDEARLHQVLANLLSNARTHTPPGTTVRAGLATSAGWVVLTVSDDGPGIDEHLQAGIFDRFVRGDSSRSRLAGSTGLGLAIVKAVVTAHGGTVSVAGRPGSTVFTVRLPAAP